MKVIKQGRSQLTLEVTRNVIPLLLLSILVYGATAFIVIITLIFLDNLGTRSIRCDRHSNNEVNCTIKNTHFLGLLSKSASLLQVQQAILNTETSESKNGNTIYTYGLSLQHKLGIQEVDSGLGVFGSNASKQNFEQIKAFLKSKESSIELNRNTFFDFDGYFITLGFIVFVSFIIYFGNSFLLGMSKSNVLIKWNFYRSLNLLSKEGFSLLGVFQKKGTKTEYVLSNIKGIEIRNSQNMDDDESSPQYALFLTFHEPVDALTSIRIDDEPHSFSGMILEDGQKVGRSLCEFLQIPTNLEPINVKGLEQLYSGKCSKFSVFGTIADLSIGKFFKDVQDRSNELVVMNFEPLGMMNVEALPNIRIAGFADVSMGIYGVIIFKLTTQKAEILSTEFYSTFTSGASLTTTTTPNVGDISHRKIFRHSAPNASLNELFTLHSDRLSKLNPDQGQTQPIEPSLLGLAKAIDEYLVREGKV